MDALESNRLKKLYADILKGYSTFLDSTFGPFFVKHLNIIDSSEIDEQYEFHYNQAQKNNIPTEKEKLEYLKKESLWNELRDKEIFDNENFIKGLIDNKKRSLLKSEVDKLNEEIKSAEIKTNQLKQEKLELIGYTSESFASKKCNEFHIYYSFFKDKDLKLRLFEDINVFYEVEENDIAYLSFLYNSKFQNFNEKNLKRLALFPFFLNSFMGAGDNIFAFWGKPLSLLTFYQNELNQNGLYFKNLLSECKDIPNDLLSDPDKLIDWFNLNKNAQGVIGKQSEEGRAEGLGIVGASKDDLKAIGVQDGQTVDLVAESKKLGRPLNMQDFLRLHGE